jgi:xylulokinase
MYLLGYDIGSSSVKAALVDAATRKTLATAQHPEREMKILAPHPDWAEQDPADWWEAACAATKKLLEKIRVAPGDIAAIGISYQMHGLVVVDKNGEVLRPAIIWCDSRAVGIGNEAFKSLGEKFCLEHYLNSPGNFTASKLRWVRENEPDIFSKIDKIMLPGDYLAYRMTGEICTTATGLSEGILWDFKEKAIAKRLLEHYEIPPKMLPDVAPGFSKQGKLRAQAAAALGLVPGIPVGYRAGDQPNNALSLNVLRPGEVAATGGTSGVVYAVAAEPIFDPEQRVNSFAHVNYSPENPLTGILLCINGAGSQYRWVRQVAGSLTRRTTQSRPTSEELTYDEMEQLAASVPIGSDGLSILPFGNGAERMLGNRVVGSRILGLNFNRHEKRQLYRAALEGIAFSFVFGIEALRDMGVSLKIIRAGNDNLFQSAIFSNTISTLVGAEIELIATTGAVGAAKAAGVSVGIYKSVEEAMANVETTGKHEPGAEKEALEEAYRCWKKELEFILHNS